VSGTEMRLLRNWVGIQNGTTKLVWLPATVVADLIADAGGSATGTVGVVSTVPLHPGGIQIAGPSRDVFVLENEIEGGSRNGISLGSLSLLDSNGKDTGTIIGVLTSPEDPCSKTGTLQVPITTPGSAGGKFVAAGQLVNVQIDRNRIRNTGLCGIGPIGFFNLLQDLEVISIENLTIAANSISSTLLRDISNDQLAALSILGYAAISVTDAENLIIRDNNITDFGAQPGTDVCGIFLLHGEMVEINGNHVMETRDWSQASANALTSTGGSRGGIVVILATPPAFTTTAALSTWSTGASADSPSYVPSLPALRIENNTVRVPLGETLAALGFGPFSIQNNHLSCGGTVTTEARPIASTVLIFNVGTAIESAASKFSSLYNDKNAAVFAGVGHQVLTNSSTGAVLFTGNICQLEAKASKQRSFASVAVLTLDHMTFADNHCWVDGPQLTASLDALLAAGSLQLASNRFQEASGFPVLASGLTVGRINIATQNLSTYCLFNIGTVKLLDVNNVAIIDLSAQELCARLTKQLNL
jgi:hypothetical protein